MVHCYSADTDSEVFPDDIVLPDSISDTIEPIPDDQIIVADPTLPIDAQSEVTVPVPLFGPLTFKIGDKPEEGLFIAMPDRDFFGALHVRDTKVRFLHGIISFKSFVTLSFPGFSLTGEMGLRELIYDTKKKGYRAVFGISFKDQENKNQLKIHCGPDLDIIFSELNLVIEPQTSQCSFNTSSTKQGCTSLNTLSTGQSYRGQSTYLNTSSIGQSYRGKYAKTSVARPAGYSQITDTETARMYFVAKSTFFKQPINLYITKTAGKFIVSLKTTDIYPFASLAGGEELKEVRKIRLYNIVAQFESFDKNQSIRFMGEGELFGIKVAAELFFGSKSDKIGGKSTTCTLVSLSIGAGNKISKLIPQLKGTLFDDFIVKDLSVIASSEAYQDPTRNVAFVQGINFYGRVGLPQTENTDLGRVRKLVGASDMIFFGGIGLPNPKSSHMLVRIPKAAIPLSAADAVNFKFNYFELEIMGTPEPAVSLAVALDMRPSSKDEWLTFVGRITIGIREAELSATLKDLWRNPFGIKPAKPIDIGKAALQLTINYMFLASTGIPLSGLGIKLELHVGSLIVDAAVKVDVANPQNSMISAELNKLELQDLIDFASLFTGAPIQVGNLPIIRFEDITLYIVPHGSSIGEFTFQQGVKFAGKLLVASGEGQPALFTADIDIAVYEKGAKGFGYCKEFNLGPIKVTGAGPDNIDGTADDGPIIDFEFFKNHNRFYLSGLVIIGDIIRSQTEINIDKNEFSMMFDNKIKNIFDSTVAISYSLKDLNAYIMIDFKQSYIAIAQKALNDYANSQNIPSLSDAQKQTVLKEVQQVHKKLSIDEYMKNLEQKVTEKETQNAQKVDSMMAKQAEKMKQIDARVAAAQKKTDEKMKAAQEKIDARIDAAQKKADDDMKAADESMKKIDARIDAALKRADDRAAGIHPAPVVDTNKPKSTQPTPAQPIKTPTPEKPTQSSTPTQPAQSVEQFFNMGLHELESLGKTITTQVTDPFAREMTKTFTAVGKELEKNIAIPSARAASFLLSQCNITHCYFKGSVIDMVQGIFPRVELEGCISGTKKSVVFQFDARSLDKGVQTITAATLDLFVRPGTGVC